jgi:hypothetical protein
MTMHWSLIVGPAMLAFLLGAALGFKLCADMMGQEEVQMDKDYMSRHTCSLRTLWDSR